MKLNRRKAMSRAVAISIALALASPTVLVKAAPGQVTRVGEVDSYETAAVVATTNWTSAKDVVLVCGEGYADAVSASVLAKQLDAPILLTQAASLNASAKDAIDKLKPQNIYIIGGNASVSQSLRDGLKSNNYNLIELGGKDRYETNAAVAKQLVKLGVKADNVMLVSGEGFSDILSATPIAAAKGQIILLGNNNKSTMKPVLDFIKSNNSSVTVIGTTYSINDNIYKEVGAVNRVSGGADRFETNLNVLNSFNNDLNTNKLFIANASGDRYADALIASSLAGKHSAPLVLVGDENSSSTDKAVNYIKGKISSSTDLNAIGGGTVISDNVISKINAAVPVVTSPTVKSVSANGLNQIKVVFNTEVDKNSAEIVGNYQLDGTNLTSNKASATLQDDNRTVLITLSDPYNQYKKLPFQVKNAVFDKSLKNTIAKFDQDITFLSTNPPTVESVTARGGNKLIVKFSEPIRMKKSDLPSLKINRQSIDNFSINTSLTVLKGQSGDWVSGLELYFDSSLPLGSNIFSIPNGTLGKLFDNAAGFSIKSASIGFTVDSPGGIPRVINISGDSSGTIYVKYDRPMDQQTALEDSNYKINGSTASVSSSDISFEEGSNDTVVKIEGLSYLLKNGENEIIVNSNVADTYGNKINEVNMKLNVGQDNIKPQVTNVNMLDNKTIRIKFNKDVVNSYATNKSNYKIVDSDGANISYKIENIYQVYSADKDSKKTYDIKFSDNDALRGSSYTLTINNIIDTNSIPNVMNTYSTIISGQGNELPKITSIVKNADNNNQVVVFFNKVMDEASIVNPDNYRFLNGNNESQKLPLSAIIYPGVDDKSVTIEFPSSYDIGNGQGEKYILQLAVQNVKDRNGNQLAAAYSSRINTAVGNGPGLIDDSAKITFNGDDIKVTLSLTAPLDIVNVKDFRVNGQTPDTAILSGNDVILTFKSGVDDNNKINNIKNSGNSTTLNISGLYSVDAAGRKLKSGSTKVLIPPMTNSNSWVAYSNKSLGTNPYINIGFNQDIDNDIVTSYSDDFIFTNQRTGQKLDIASVRVDGRTVIYSFYNGSVISGDKIDVRANDDISKINIRNKQYNNGNYAIYSPSRDDLKVRTIVVR